ncbi:AmmeMemoRadiSam system radical SAM enzyme [candidate division KSB1 bacterium]|nr:AmmeMemoRadiSam system radical SAM enzyme [candidate division KSB1 bacterium]
MKLALFYEKLADQKVRCHLCPHDCLIAPGKVGICKVRQNRDGELWSLIYGKIIAKHVDPIEKKPLFHVLPGSESYSIATVGCNFHCDFCQNSDISQAVTLDYLPGEPMTPETVVSQALKNNCRSIAYTYTEPTVFFEFAYDCARLAQAQGLINIFVTNGYINPEPLTLMQPYLAAANVDLKGFDPKFYQRTVGGKLNAVLEALKKMHQLGIFLEITTLIIPGVNDNFEHLKAIAQFIKTELGPGTPWHLSRFYPQYKMTTPPPTPLETLVRARELGLAAGLRYVYTGNVHHDAGEHTYCYQCQRQLITRAGFFIRENRITASHCPDCGAVIDGIWL